MFEWYLESVDDDDELLICISLNECRKYLIGRTRNYDIELRNPLVSREHGIITLRDNIVYIKDTDSSNGIWINDMKIKPNREYEVQENDVIGIGAPRTALEQKKELFRLRIRTLNERYALWGREHVEAINNVQPINNVGPINNVEPVNNLEPINNVNPANNLEPVNNLEPINNLNPANNLEPVNNLEPINNVNPANNVEPANNIQLINNIEPMNNVEPANNVEPVINVELVNSPEPINNIELANNLEASNNQIKEEPEDLKSEELDLSDFDFSDFSNEAQELSTNKSDSPNKSEPDKNSQATDESLKFDIDIVKQEMSRKISDKIKQFNEAKEKPATILNDDGVGLNIAEASTSHAKVEPVSNYSQEMVDKVILSDDDEDIFPRSQLFDDVKVKAELISNANFSREIIDEVNLSDDDDIFPRSQLFDDVQVKVEKRGTSVPQYFDPVDLTIDDESENIFGIIRKEVEIDDYIRFEDDSNDDCITWLNKLSQSQENLASSQEQTTKSFNEQLELDDNDLERDESPKETDQPDLASKLTEENSEQDQTLKKTDKPAVTSKLTEEDSERDEALKKADKPALASKLTEEDSEQDKALKKTSKLDFAPKLTEKDSALKKIDKPALASKLTEEGLERNEARKKTDKPDFASKSTEKDLERNETLNKTVKPDFAPKLNEEDLERGKASKKTSKFVPKVCKVQLELLPKTLPSTNDDLGREAAPEETSPDLLQVIDDQLERIDHIKETCKLDSNDDKTLKAKNKTELVSKPKPNKSLKKSYVVPPVIEAPVLKKGKRKAHVDAAKSRESTKVRRKSIQEEPSVSVKPCSSGTHINKSVKNELDKRHKYRKKNKKQETEPVPKENKQLIQEERKRKLKELACKQVEAKKEETDIPKSHTKPKVKISESRGLFLTDKESPKKIPKYVIPLIKRNSTEMSGPSTSKDTNTTTDNIKRRKLDKSEVKNDEVEVGKSKPNDTKINENVVVEPVKSKPVVPKGILKIFSTCGSTERHVVFNENKNQCITFEIEPGNRLNKCSFKDAPIPRTFTECRTEAETLFEILNWVPMWLEEQKLFAMSPNVSTKVPGQMLYTFNTYLDYYNTVTPLMLLELWRSIFKDWTNVHFPVIKACVDHKSKPLTEHNLVNLQCHCVITKQEADPHIMPNRGDLLIMELFLNDGRETIKKFGYVEQVNKRRLNNKDMFNGKLITSNVIPDYLVNIKIKTKELSGNINSDGIIRIRVVSRIAPYLRIFKSVQQLNASPLCKFILKPNVQDFKIPKISEMKLAIGEHTLDTDQLRCVVEACQICRRTEPGIYLIQGPPGTGKSLVIKKIIQQLLYGNKLNMKKMSILVCAPSNGAIDELTMRLLEMRTQISKEERFKMIRMGPMNSIHPKVKGISVTSLADHYVKHQLSKQISNGNREAEMDDYNFRQSKINTLQNQYTNFKEAGKDTRQIEDQLATAQKDLELFRSRSKRELTPQERAGMEKDAEIQIIEGANVVCTTLSSCMGSKMEELHKNKRLRFTCCIVDEATQSNEQENLIPLMLGITNLVLVGDPMQLPSTVLSQEAKRFGYGTSLFARIQQSLDHLPGNPVRLLRTQYRMHADICDFPSKCFYNGQLVTAKSVLERNDCKLAPMRLFSLHLTYNSQQVEYLNKSEACIVMLLAGAILRRTQLSVGIITPYSKQRDYLRRKYSETIEKELREIKEETRLVVNTVDGFQGQERDVIIISCVRSNSNMFLADYQRLNVSLTRAKYALYIFANSQLLQTGDIWRRLVDHTKCNNNFYQLNENQANDEQYVWSLINL